MAGVRPKANLQSLSELKNTSDDAIAPYLKFLGWKQNHILTDVHLALGFAACVIAGGTFYYDYTLGFEKAKPWTLYTVIAYFIINSALTWWIWGVEGARVFVGTKDGIKITISSHTEKHSPIYQLKFVSEIPGVAAPLVVEEKGPFTNWFDTQGYLIEKPFKAFLQLPLSATAAAAKGAPTQPKSKTRSKGAKKA